MGVPGMLRALRAAAERDFPLSACRGSTVGVDVFIWAHQEVRHHLEEVVRGEAPPDYTGVVAALKNRVLRLTMKGIRLLMVSDGRRLPGKWGTDEERARRRATAQASIDAAVAARQERQAAAGAAAGQDDVADALDDGDLEVEIEADTLQAAASVTDALVTDIIRMLRQLAGVAYLKAPDEADAQLAALDALDLVQYVITEDGDMVANRCRRVLCKVEYKKGTAHLYARDRLERGVPPGVDGAHPLLDLCKKWTTACLPFFAAGKCDFCNLPGWGATTMIAALKKVRGGKVNLGALTPATLVHAMGRVTGA
jgi:exonuclease-1